jgi:hypothetical protein
MLAHVDSGGLDASATLPSVDIGHVVSLSDQVAKTGVLAPNSEALFAKELSDLLVSLEAASPRYGMEIACVLAGKASEDMIRRVKMSLRSKRKKMVISWKLHDCLIDGPFSSWRVRLVGLLCGVVLFVFLDCGCCRLRELVGCLFLVDAFGVVCGTVVVSVFARFSFN